MTLTLTLTLTLFFQERLDAIASLEYEKGKLTEENLRLQRELTESIEAVRKSEEERPTGELEAEVQRLSAESAGLKWDLERSQGMELELSETTRKLKEAAEQMAGLTGTVRNQEALIEELRERSGPMDLADERISSLTEEIRGIEAEFKAEKIKASGREMELREKMRAQSAMREAMGDGDVGDQIEMAYEKVRELQQEMAMMEAFHNRQTNALREELEASQKEAEASLTLTLTLTLIGGIAEGGRSLSEARGKVEENEREGGGVAQGSSRVL